MVFSSLLDASHVKTCLCWAKRAGAHVAGIRFWQWDHLACQLRVKYFSWSHGHLLSVCVGPVKREGKEERKRKRVLASCSVRGLHGGVCQCLCT